MSILLNQTNISPAVTLFEKFDITEEDNISAFNTAFYLPATIDRPIPYINWGNPTSFAVILTIPNSLYQDIDYVYRFNMTWSIPGLTFDSTNGAPNGTLSVIVGIGGNQLTPFGGSTAFVSRDIVSGTTPFVGGTVEFVFAGYSGNPLTIWIVNSTGAPTLVPGGAPAAGTFQIASLVIAKETTRDYTNLPPIPT